MKATITATKVPNNRRLAAMPKVFGGSHCVTAETAIFNTAGELIDDYKGGYWEFYALSNGGFYMAPRIGAPVRVKVDGNGYDDTMSADAAGIVCCLMAYSNESFRAEGTTYGDRVAEAFHALRDFAGEHAEASAIFSAID